MSGLLEGEESNWYEAMTPSVHSQAHSPTQEPPRREPRPAQSAKGFKTMKYVCFVKRIDFELSGSPGGQGMALGDITGDGCIVLCVGSVDGRLTVYRHTSSRPWLQMSRLGTILCVEVIRLKNCMPYIAVLSAEGWCRMFSVSSSQDELIESGGLRRLPRNLTNMTFFDPSTTSQSDHHSHVVMGGLDRTVYLYKVECAEQEHCSNVPVRGVNDSQEQLPHSKHSFVLLARYRAEHAITSLAVHKTLEETSILVGLSSCMYLELKVCQDDNGETFDWDNAPEHRYFTEKDPHVVKRVQSSRTGVERTYIAVKGKQIACATQDGKVHVHGDELPIVLSDMLIPGVSFVDDPVCPTEICLCTWGGDVYFIDNERNAIRFSMHAPVRCFIQGRYSIGPGVTTLCVFCVTFDGHICMFSDVAAELTSVKHSLLSDAFAEPAFPTQSEGSEGHDFDSKEEEKQWRNSAKVIRTLLYRVSPADVKSLEAYKKALKSRLEQAT